MELPQMIIMGTLKSNEWPVIDANLKNTRRTNDDEPLKMKCFLLSMAPRFLTWKLLGWKEEEVDAGKGTRIPKWWCKKDPHWYSLNKRLVGNSISWGNVWEIKVSWKNIWAWALEPLGVPLEKQILIFTISPEPVLVFLFPLDLLLLIFHGFLTSFL